jgi:hypothetical protein
MIPLNEARWECSGSVAARTVVGHCCCINCKHWAVVSGGRCELGLNPDCSVRKVRAEGVTYCKTCYSFVGGRKVY